MRFPGSSKLVRKRDVSGGGGGVDGGVVWSSLENHAFWASESMYYIFNGPKEGGSEMGPKGGEGILPNAPISKP